MVILSQRRKRGTMESVFVFNRHYVYNILVQHFPLVCVAATETRKVLYSFKAAAMFKRCRKCSKLKLFTEFGKNKNSKDGLRSECRSCKTEADALYRSNHREEINESKRRWNNSNLEYFAEYRQKNIGKVRQNNRKRDLKYKQSKGESLLERVRRQSKEWRQNHPEKGREYARNRRARVLGAVGNISVAEIEALKKFYNYTCLCCGKREPDVELTHDHVKPLSRGGENTIQNSQVLCRSCNCKKGAKHIDYRGPQEKL